MFGDYVSRILFIDASTEEYEDEAEGYEEEEHFDQYPNQGKLIPMQALLVQDSKDTLAIYFIQGTIPIPSFDLASFYLSKCFYSSPVSKSSITTSVSRV